jgi:phosphonoacetaldehyde hydrolase
MSGLEVVIFDWAGTIVDHGSLAPVRAVCQLFARHDVVVDEATARRDMGLFKRDHIRRILETGEIQQRWREVHGNAWSEADIDGLFSDFQLLQMEVLQAHSKLIFDAGALGERLRRRGLKIATTTGYTRPMLDLLLASAAEQGFRPDLAISPDEAGGGRPHPWMCLKIALATGLSAMRAAVKIGDTPADVAEGLNAGMWTIGVSATGNETGLSADDLAALADCERKRRLKWAECSLRQAGAHYVIESAAGCEAALEAIERRIAAGERP